MILVAAAAIVEVEIEAEPVDRASATDDDNDMMRERDLTSYSDTKRTYITSQQLGECRVDRKRGREPTPCAC